MSDEHIEQARRIVASDPRNAPFEDWQRSVLGGEHDDHQEIARLTNPAPPPPQSSRPALPHEGMTSL